MRVCHLLRPAEGGMLSQVRSLLNDDALLAAPPAVLAKLADAVSSAPYPLSPSGSPLAQIRSGRAAGRWACGRADVLHGHGLARVLLYAAAAKTSGLPLVVTLHNLVPPLSLPEKLVAKAALSVARKVICVSQAVSESAAVLVPKEKRVVIRNGVRITPGPNNGELVGRGQGEILCVARLAPEKGIDVLLSAMERLPDARLLVAGDGPERNELEASAGKNVAFLGFVEDIPALLERAALVVVPSRSEGLGLSALEAMAAGKPVVASRIGGLCEVVVHGETGLLVPPGDPEALAEALKSLLADPARARKMGEAGRARVRAEFDVQAMREKTRAVWEGAMR